MSKGISWSAATGIDRLQQTLERVETDVPQVRSIFTQTFSTETAINQRKIKTPLSGALVTVKDLFDVEGYVSRAGTVFMQNDDPASSFASPIRQLRDAGAILVGHTNMTELAYSGLGINPHYGTPKNALSPLAVPGGSSAGGAVSVAIGLADIAIGTDTGGSLRIPAAFNGIVGFKPSQSTVSRDGCKALSHTLDSVGPMAKNVSACRLAYHTMRQSIEPGNLLSKPTLVIPENFGLTDMDAETSAAFDAAVGTLDNANFKIEKKGVPSLESIQSVPAWHFTSVEARAYYQSHFREHATQIDPRVRSRLARADEISAVEYFQSLLARESIIKTFNEEFKGHVLLMPTSPIQPPLLSELLRNDDRYHSANSLVLRNPSTANMVNGCSISLPFVHKKTTIGIMLTAPALHDNALLNLAEQCELALLS